MRPVTCNAANHLASFHDKAGERSSAGNSSAVEPRQVTANTVVKQPKTESLLTVANPDNVSE